MRKVRTRPERMAAIFCASVGWGGSWTYFMDVARTMIAMRKISTPMDEIDRFLHAKYGAVWGLGWDELSEWKDHAAFCFKRFDEA